MYPKEDERREIAEIQKYLHTRAAYDEDAPVPPIDGIYGNETRNAVSRFQKTEGLPETGSVDLDTYNALRDFAESPGAGGEKVLARQDRCEEVGELNVLLSIAAEDHRDLRPVYGFYFGSDTERDVRAMQKIFGMPATGIADAPFLAKLRAECDCIKQQKS